VGLMALGIGGCIKFEAVVENFDQLLGGSSHRWLSELVTMLLHMVDRSQLFSASCYYCCCIICSMMLSFD
jgi:hypothetical protein